MWKGSGSITPWNCARENSRHICCEYVLLGIIFFVYKRTGRNSFVLVRLDQDRIYIKSNVNGREMASIRWSGKAIYGRFWRQGDIRWRCEVTDIEGRGTYQRSRAEDGTDLTPQYWQRGDWGKAHVRGESIIGQGGSKEEERRVLSGGYQR